MRESACVCYRQWRERGEEVGEGTNKGAKARSERRKVSRRSRRRWECPRKSIDFLPNSKSTFPAPVLSFCRSFSFFLLLTGGARDRAEREHEESERGTHRELFIQRRFSSGVFLLVPFIRKKKKNRRENEMKIYESRSRLSLSLFTFFTFCFWLFPFARTAVMPACDIAASS